MRDRSILFLLSILIVAMEATAALAASKRGHYALVIGNSAYKAPDAVLSNPVNDARAMRAALKRLGFQVVYGEDLDRARTFDVIERFLALSRKMKVALFYYAGHGIQINSQNYMVPVDASFTGTFNLSDQVVSMRHLIRGVDAVSESGLIFLDACRNNPFGSKISAAANRGLTRATRSMGWNHRAAVPLLPSNQTSALPDELKVGVGLAGMQRQEMGIGMLLVYSTSPGRVAADGTGRHSPFTGALLNHIEKPGLEIRQVITRVTDEMYDPRSQQIPWDNSSLRKDVYLAGLSPNVARPSRNRPVTRSSSNRTGSSKRKSGQSTRRKTVSSGRTKKPVLVLP